MSTKTWKDILGNKMSAFNVVIKANATDKDELSAWLMKQSAEPNTEDANEVFDDLAMRLLEDAMRDRIWLCDKLRRHEEIILYEWPNWDEHVEWVISAPVDEIAEWAESIEEE